MFCSVFLYRALLQRIMQLLSILSCIFFAVKFEPTQQDLLIVDNIYNRVTVGLQRSCLFSFYNYDINILFFLISIAGFFKFILYYYF